MINSWTWYNVVIIIDNGLQFQRSIGMVKPKFKTLISSAAQSSYWESFSDSKWNLLGITTTVVGNIDKLCDYVY